MRGLNEKVVILVKSKNRNIIGNSIIRTLIINSSNFNRTKVDLVTEIHSNNSNICSSGNE